MRLAVLTGAVAVSLATFAAPSSAGTSGGVRVREILNGYERPILVTNDGVSQRLYIVEQGGRILMARETEDGWRKVGLFLDLSSLVSDLTIAGNGERGLLGLAFDPDYATNGLFYVNYTRRSDGVTVIAEYRGAGRNADPATARIVLTIHQPYANHNGGNLAFGPDGYLYIGMGDGGAGGDPQNRAQDLSTLLGKLLRIDPHDPPGLATFSIPQSNPFRRMAARPAIWALGLRNPWRWSFDRVTGDLWIGDVGQGVGGATGFEEINRSRARRGRNAGRAINYGWDLCEARHRYTGSYDPEPPRCTVHTLPVIEEPQQADGFENCAIVGGFVHRGRNDPAWHGTYVYGDTCSGRVWAVNARTLRRLDRIATGRTISSFGEDVHGRMFMTDLAGAVLRVRFAGRPPG
jgi:glucose/arabinose dehydrogenase